jgi:selenocysteine-specific elongation factor
VCVCVYSAVLVTQLDAKAVERAIVCAPGTIPTFSAAIISVEKVRFYKSSCPSKRKFHVTTGHTTVMATAHFFVLPSPPGTPAGSPLIQGPGAGKETAIDFGKEYLLADELLPTSKDAPGGSQWALILLEKPITAPKNSLLIGSVLDTDLTANACRIAFHGRILDTMDPAVHSSMAQLRAYKPKSKTGNINRVVDDTVVIGKP